MPIKYLLLILCCFILSPSCRRKCPCNPASAPIQLVSFLNSEIDTIIVRRFIKETNFQTLQDSVLLDNSNCSYIVRGTDTLELATSNLIGRITSSFDYEVYIPSVNSLIKISDITEQLTEGNCGRCSNYFTMFLMDGQIYHSSQLFIKK